MQLLNKLIKIIEYNSLIETIDDRLAQLKGRRAKQSHHKTYDENYVYTEIK